MRRRLPPLNALLAFEAAARHGNFTRAAHELSVAQPAVTRHIANLENWFGTSLFRRNGNHVSLTAQGQEVADLALGAFDRLELGFDRLAKRGENELVIGASFGMAHLWVMPRISELRDAAHGAAINFVTSDTYTDFDSNKVDFSIRFGTGHWPGYAADLLFREEVQVIATPKFLQAHPGLDPNNLTETLTQDWMLDHGDEHAIGWFTWHTWHQHHQLGFDTTRLFTEIRNYPTLLDMVLSGEGVGLGSSGLEDPHVLSGELVRLGPVISRPDHGYYLVYDPDTLEKPAAQNLRNHLLTEAKHRLDSGETP
ncbi:hypothetical protein DS909_03485 [Phaeobacter gallaeciensis]|uniref:HTH lysR-type domain-containing protein n=2 Tax=Roseobacteraceae TaxID=2854170 RepID=A0A366X990_9RHOB|nr:MULTISPECIES: LysR substrate-binding domain-containing protein [Roseobacteraceae]MBT3142510.1 LysR family transcriptional regulator [Falsiruegeria litorea]MBT8169262.1 LysR family transcriptional regulator [Falsiruegeria litorea]RBW60500.1 hypothetical protein DS909_03485 [Phaeobacter gallaeciensis]